MRVNRRLLNTKEASAYLEESRGVRRAPATLNQLRYLGGGPAFRRIGTRNVAYEQSELDRWAQSLIGPPLETTNGDF